MIKTIFDKLKFEDNAGSYFSEKQLDEIAKNLMSEDSEAKKKESLCSIIEER